MLSVSSRIRYAVRRSLSTTSYPSAELTKSSMYPGKEYERENCGVGFIANMKGRPSRDIVEDANEMLARMAHRGGVGCDPNTGDGAGILTAIPDQFFRKVAKETLKIDLPALGQYGVGQVFMQNDKHAVKACKQLFEKVLAKRGIETLGWRRVPTNNASLGESAVATEPRIEQIFVRNSGGLSSSEFEQSLYTARKATEVEITKMPHLSQDFYVCSLSSNKVVYKGQLTPEQLPEYYSDLQDKDLHSHFALVHSRFSTNTFPSWDRAQPSRMMCHNGEINTLRGNVNWMLAREATAVSPSLGPHQTAALFPTCSDEYSDSGNLDAVLELLTQTSSMSMPEAILMLVPEAYQSKQGLHPDLKGLYDFMSMKMEPWDGPAMLAFTDGKTAGACLDRNGLRPSRFYVTHDDRVILSSEVGVVPELKESEVRSKGRLEPGRMLLIDFEQGKIVDDQALKMEMASKRPYAEWMTQNRTTIEDWTNTKAFSPKSAGTHWPDLLKTSKLDKVPKDRLTRLLSSCGYTTETLNMLLLPMATGIKKEALGSMGNDAPLAILSDMPKLPFEYFKQLFAQVTNPPIDPIREELVMDLSCPVGPEGNLLDLAENDSRRLIVEHPVLLPKEMSAVKSSSHNGWYSAVIDATIPLDDGAGLSDGAKLSQALDLICAQATSAIETQNAPIIVLSHENVSESRVAVPSLIAVGALHQHLLRTRLRGRTAIFVDSGDAREVHDFCTLLGFGADAICPTLAYAAFDDLRESGMISAVSNNTVGENEEIFESYRNAAGKGILKVMSKMGISTLQSYKGAQIFEAIGLDSSVMSRCFNGTASRLSGAGWEELAADMRRFHFDAFGTVQMSDTSPSKKPVRSYSVSWSETEISARRSEEIKRTHSRKNLTGAGRRSPPALLPNPGNYHWRNGGEIHANAPESMHALQNAAKSGAYEDYKHFASVQDRINEGKTIRGCLEFRSDESEPVPLDQVEPVENIVKRFVTGAMSLGSISQESHETLALAMNHLGGKSNTGEGGEESRRYTWRGENGESMRSAIKQVASGRFGVTSHYLANADQIQIKMAQGAKPGEGGELPGHKAVGIISDTRRTTPGVGLISPPPHHDIYSIEDLAQLIHDLKNSNPRSMVSTKLVSEIGVGVVAAGVAKAFSDHITISGGDGGTGAAAWTGVKNCGLPWELGLAETQQTLVLNDLRGRVVVQADGGMKTARDVVIAALLGAEEFGFATAPLIAMGCIMMRKCHLNTCPVGIATQDPVLRKKFRGTPEHVINYFWLMSQEIREYMAEMGFTSMDEMIGRADKLRVNKQVLSDKAGKLDLRPILRSGETLNPKASPRRITDQDHGLEKALDVKLISEAMDVLEGKTESVEIFTDVSNLNRSVGTMLSYEISKRHGEHGLELGNDAIRVNLNGHCGQSFGFALARGVTLNVKGDANDYCGKGLSGGKIVVSPVDEFDAEPSDQVVAGNTLLYGATSGEVYLRGRVGERFCVRNSGAEAVSEGCGDHGCEYMTGGNVLIIGPTGRNFAAGMSGGIAYVYDEDGKFGELRCNQAMVFLETVDKESEDEWKVQDMLMRHVNETNSDKAREILKRWNHGDREKFAKVYPKDYKKAMEEMRRDEEGNESMAGSL